MESVVGNILIGNIFNGTIEKATVADGYLGSGLSFDGVDDWLDLGNHRDECLGNTDLCPDGFTLSMWLKRGQKVPIPRGELYYITSGGHTFQSFGFALYSKMLNTLSFSTTTTTLKWGPIEVSVEPGPWYHVVATWHGRTGIRLFIDGCLLGTWSTKSERYYDNSGGYDTITVGRPNNAMKAAHFGEAIIDEFYFWPRHLTYEEVWAHHRKEITLKDQK